ncbi:hypothetical protein Ddye_015426 [Dipteronia dyeriana]|uniref:non-specific serine/threonine protein kinase n=1 Tax=Dipteronia dyeriana TaxID=168575 RepID=A0AAD9U592_9ROSI|nr:hypothetical protein Ddye_015426 [Dipteronia dyeriana]
MKSTIFPIPLLFFFITNLRLSIIFPGYVYGIDDRYSNCSSSFNCGKFKDIGYPFWGNDQPEYCGHPSFKLENCQEADNVTMDSLSWKYHVINIHSETQVLKLARMDFSASICPETIANNSLDEKLFSYTINDEYATLLYDCDPTQDPAAYDGQFSCPINNIPRNAYFNSDRSTYSSSVVTSWKCKISLLMPILVISAQGFWNHSLSINQVVIEGFEVRWIIDALQCKDCINSGGKCGYNITLEAFSCFCPDNAHTRVCRSPQTTPSTNQQDGSADAPSPNHVKVDSKDQFGCLFCDLKRNAPVEQKFVGKNIYVGAILMIIMIDTAED